MCEKELTMREISEKLLVSMQTLHTWRKGSPLRDPLTANRQERGAGFVVTICECNLLDYLEKYRPDLVHRWPNQP